MFTPLIAGFLISISLIAAIGAQNAFVLRQGIRQEHVLPVVLTCALSDAILITLGVAGFGTLVALAPWISTAMLYAGAVFLLIYGGLRFRAALQGGEALMPAPGTGATLRATLVTCLVLTWANPHVYLDTVLLLGRFRQTMRPNRCSSRSARSRAASCFSAPWALARACLRPFLPTLAHGSCWRSSSDARCGQLPPR